MTARQTQTRTTRTNAKDRLGAAAVEMALVLPVFVTVILGIIEIGRAVMVGQLVTSAAHEAARAAVLDGSTNSSVSDVATSFLQSSAGVSAGNVTVTISVSSGSAGNQVANAAQNDLITVTVSVPFATVSYLPPSYMAGKSLSATCAMRHE